jgi:hypothetical protein
VQPTLVTSLEPGGPSACTNHWRWIQRLHRRFWATPQTAPSLPQTPPASPHTGHLQTHGIWVRKLEHTPPMPLIHFYSVSLVLRNSPFKITSRKTQLSHNSMVSGLYSVMFTEWDQLRNQGWSPDPDLQLRAGMLCMDTRKSYLHVLFLYSRLFKEKPLFLANVMCWMKLVVIDNI